MVVAAAHPLRESLRVSRTRHPASSGGHDLHPEPPAAHRATWPAAVHAHRDGQDPTRIEAENGAARRRLARLRRYAGIPVCPGTGGDTVVCIMRRNERHLSE